MSGDVGMSGMITALTDSTTGITSSNLWAEVTAAAPLVVTLVVFGFGLYILRRVIKGSKKGQPRI